MFINEQGLTAGQWFSWCRLSVDWNSAVIYVREIWK